MIKDFAYLFIVFEIYMVLEYVMIERVTKKMERKERLNNTEISFALLTIFIGVLYVIWTICLLFTNQYVYGLLLIIISCLFKILYKKSENNLFKCWLYKILDMIVSILILINIILS